MWIFCWLQNPWNKKVCIHPWVKNMIKIDIRINNFLLKKLIYWLVLKWKYLTIVKHPIFRTFVEYVSFTLPPENQDVLLVNQCLGNHVRFSSIAKTSEGWIVKDTRNNMIYRPSITKQTLQNQILSLQNVGWKSKWCKNYNFPLSLEASSLDLHYWFSRWLN